jgi:hypothetical protein
MGSLMAMLTFGTLGFFAALAYLSARAVQRLKDDPGHKPSSLCAKSEHWVQAQE